ncbi:hypothetical protein NL676_030845 [Syzygium grande]|nr:hypothetical protein NL676_030845 [Syzygium grande]
MDSNGLFASCSSRSSFPVRRYTERHLRDLPIRFLGVLIGDGRKDSSSSLTFSRFPSPPRRPKMSNLQPGSTKLSNVRNGRVKDDPAGVAPAPDSRNPQRPHLANGTKDAFSFLGTRGSRRTVIGLLKDARALRGDLDLDRGFAWRVHDPRNRI